MDCASDPFELSKIRRAGKERGASQMKPASKKEGASPHLDEGSAVRERKPSGHPSSPDLNPPLEVRIEEKFAAAEALLAGLPANDSRHRLLQAASLRRDEGLLDAILSTLREPKR
jgi:hypothetical protein